jgi:diketogulonate reductase-like aldo/keto reductase
MENLNKYSELILSNGIKMPVVGIGTHGIESDECKVDCIKLALKSGYRLIDTARYYKNEKSIGKALISFGLLREEYFLTTKLKWDKYTREDVLKAIDRSLLDLGRSYVDLFLVHWPYESEDNEEAKEIRKQTWRAMEEIYKAGKAKAIGVSNFSIELLEELLDYAYIDPVVNQVEFHPFLYQKELLDFCKENDVVLQAHTPLVQGKKMNHPIIVELAEKHNRTPAQVLLRWSLQHGCSIIPKSEKEDHIEENIDIFDFELAESDMSLLDGLNEDLRLINSPFEK